MDHDDWALVLPPPEYRKVVQTISGSGVPITDVILRGFEIESNHPSGGFFGPRACGRNFRRLLEAHPVYIDPISSLAGAYMVNFMSYRKPHWNPEFSYSHLEPEHRRYQLAAGIGGAQHFCHDLQIGFDLGWGGILERIRHYRAGQPRCRGLLRRAGGCGRWALQNWIARHAEAAAAVAQTEPDPALRRNLEEMAEINRAARLRAAADLPRGLPVGAAGFRWPRGCTTAAARWAASTCCCCPFYERDIAAGILDDEEAIFTSPACCCATRPTSSSAGRTQTGTRRDQSRVLPDARSRTPAATSRPTSASAWATTRSAPAAHGVWRSSSRTRTRRRSSWAVDNTINGFARNGYPAGVGARRAPTPVVTGAPSPAASTP